ncbi:putative leader peptide [Haloechinothrix aidingensis]|nr:putative leader peptide [Haloechinothrix aidingensis]
MALDELYSASTAASAAAVAEALALVQRRHIDLLRVNSALCRM